MPTSVSRPLSFALKGQETTLEETDLSVSSQSLCWNNLAIPSIIPDMSNRTAIWLERGGGSETENWLGELSQNWSGISQSVLLHELTEKKL